MSNLIGSLLKALKGHRSHQQVMARLQAIKAVESPAQTNGHFESAFRNLQSNLRLKINAREKIFLLTSVKPKEGKSTVAVNLAQSLSTSSKDVLLVDADLRQPVVHRILGIPNRVGFSDVLMGKVSLFTALQSTSTGMVLTSGALPPNPEDLIRSERILRALEEMRNNFEVVIMDSPPVLSFADTALLAAHVDGTILVLKYREVKTEQVELAKQRLASVGAKITGCIINYLDGDFNELAKF